VTQRAGKQQPKSRAALAKAKKKVRELFGELREEAVPRGKPAR
jgi:hypothetical protein